MKLSDIKSELAKAIREANGGMLLNSIFKPRYERRSKALSKVYKLMDSGLVDVCHCKGCTELYFVTHGKQFCSQKCKVKDHRMKKITVKM